MSCSNCGSTIPCGCIVSSCSGSYPAGYDQNSVSAESGCCEPATAATPQPYYTCQEASPQSHVQRVDVQSYAASLKLFDSWNVPACEESVTVTVPGLKSVNLGSYLWNSTYGYFEITGFNAATEQITLTNHCNAGNAAEGTEVPACTDFVVTIAPCDCQTLSAVCLAVDFTAPDVEACLDITLTGIGTIQEGDTILLGGGRYRVGGIVSTTSINICNDGLGITPGTPVVALDSAGNYQYCILIVGSCDTFSDVQVLTSPLLSGNIDDVTDTISTTPITLDIDNESGCHDMQVLVTYMIDIPITLDAATSSMVMQVDLNTNVNAAGYSAFRIIRDTLAELGSATSYFRQVVAHSAHTVPPGGNLNIGYYASIQNYAEGAGALTAAVSNAFATLTAIAVAA